MHGRQVYATPEQAHAAGSRGRDVTSRLDDICFDVATLNVECRQTDFQFLAR